MWRHLLAALGESGHRAIAPDLPGYGDSAPDPPGTWEHHVEALERFWQGLGLERAVLVVHDWGGLITLRWVLDHHPDAVAGLVASNTGFFPDGEWHGMGAAMRTEGQGEALVDSLSREGFGGLLAVAGRGFDERAIDEYWKGFTSPEGRRGMLELYRSGDFSKLEPYRGRLADLSPPALILWGENDEYAPPSGAYRFVKEIPDAKLVLVEDAGHFVFEDEPERCAHEIIEFLRDAPTEED